MEDTISPINIFVNGKNKNIFMGAKKMIAKNYTLKKFLDDYEIELLKDRLRSYNYDITRTAKALKIPRMTLYNKMKRLGIKVEKKIA